MMMRAKQQSIRLIDIGPFFCVRREVGLATTTSYNHRNESSVKLQMRVTPLPINQSIKNRLRSISAASSKFAPPPPSWMEIGPTIVWTSVVGQRNEILQHTHMARLFSFFFFDFPLQEQQAPERLPPADPFHQEACLRKPNECQPPPVPFNNHQSQY